MVPGAGLTMMEQMGLADKTQRFTRTDGTNLGTGMGPLPESMNEFTRLDLEAKIFKPPAVKFKDLEAAVSSSIRYNTLPFKVKADYIRITDSTILTTITIQFERRDLQFQQKDNVAKSTVNIFGRVTSIAGRIVNTFEDPVTVEVPADLLGEGHRWFIDLSKGDSAGSWDVPAECGLQGYRGRQYGHLFPWR